MSPPSIAPGTSTTLVLAGNGFLPGTQTTFSVFSPPGVTVNSTAVISETELHVNLTVDPAAASGTRNAFVWTPGTGPGALATSFGACGGCLTVTAPP